MFSFKDKHVVNSLRPGNAIWCCRFWLALVQVMAWCLMAPSLHGTKPLPGPVLTYHWWPRNTFQWNFIWKFMFSFKKVHLNMSSTKCSRHFAQASWQHQALSRSSVDLWLSARSSKHTSMAFNSLAHGKCGCNFKSIIFKLIFGFVSWALSAKLIFVEGYRILHWY